MLDERRPYRDEAWLEAEFAIKGRTLRDIAEPYDVTFQRIGQLVKEFNLMEKQNALRKPYTNKEWLSKEFVDKRRTQQSIADECGVCRDTITTWVDRHKLKRKSFTKEEIAQRNVASQNRLYATDPEYRRKKIKNAREWQQQNPERWNKYHREYDRKRRKKEVS